MMTRLRRMKYPGGKKLASPSERDDPVRSTHPKKARSKTRPVVRKNLPLSKTGANAGIPGDNGAAAAVIPQAGVRNPAPNGVRAVAEGIGEEGNHRPPLEFEVVKNLTAVKKGDTVRVECGAAYCQHVLEQDGVVKFSVARNKELVEEDVKLVDSVLAELPAISERLEWISIPEDYGEDESVAAEALLRLKGLT